MEYQTSFDISDFEKQYMHFDNIILNTFLLIIVFKC